MEVHAKQDFSGTWTIRRLFITGLVGFIVAVSSFTWLVIGNTQFEYELAQQKAQKTAQLVQRAARYDGNWHNIEGSWLITTISISNNGLNMAIHVVDNQGNEGTGSVVFTGEPIPITITVNESFGSYIVNMTMILNNTAGTRLNVTADTTPFIFEKVGT